MSVLIIRKDKGYSIEFTIKDSENKIYILTGYKIMIRSWPVGEKSDVELNKECPIINEAEGTCGLLLTGTEFPTAENYEAELELTKTGIVETTNRFMIKVRD